MLRRPALAVLCALLPLACARGETDAGNEDVGPGAIDSIVIDTFVPPVDTGDPFDLGAEASDDASVDSTMIADGDAGAETGAECTSGELCGDGLDNDCDGDVDEGCGCQPGRVMPCYRGAPSTRGRGVCRDGSMTCVGSGEFGSWGPCTGDVLPKGEVCDSEAADENCNGTANEGCECSVGAPPLPCGTNVGACELGEQHCVDGKLGPCTGGVTPQPEKCNNIDDDCDGVIDEGISRSCGVAVGACKAGNQFCAAGAWGACIGATGPTPEKCNNVDDDCNGVIDDGITAACGSSVGTCKPGVATCSAGTFGACVGETAPAAEICDGLDNNCNGSADEGCACTPGVTRVCGSSIGECKQGTETCSSAGAWGACMGAVTPTPEICNGKDDNCNGMIDEGGVCPKLPPTVMCPMGVSTTVGTAITLSGGGSDPDGGAVTYKWAVSTSPTGSLSTPAAPTSASTPFTPDTAGSYTLQLCVTDDEGVTSCCTTTVTAAAPCTPPTAPVATTCGTSWDRRPIIEFASTPIPAGVTYQVVMDGPTPTTLATLTTVGQNYFRPATAVAAGGPPPGSTARFYVRACKTGEPTCCANSAPVTASLVEECTMPVPAAAGNVLFSEYVVDGETGQAGEAIEITNLSHCPLTLNGTHFSYINKDDSASSVRWRNFGAAEIVPPRGVYVAIRSGWKKCGASLGSESAGLFGLKVSTLEMQGELLGNGWFENTGGGKSKLRLATGSFVNMTSGTTIALIAPYAGSSVECQGTGYNAIDACGAFSGSGMTTLMPNQLGRLWHPCDAVVAPVPATCK